jgi:hypothetical protein
MRTPRVLHKRRCRRDRAVSSEEWKCTNTGAASLRASGAARFNADSPLAWISRRPGPARRVVSNFIAPAIQDAVLDPYRGSRTMRAVGAWARIAFGRNPEGTATVRGRRGAR